ncbi:unnamed protein product [Polarella glacialis]|uniref:C3H1-type domain-containing protein n=1 Tax=Polarella glacialis TaxID=89957 RepID=A0A813E2J2_POLGL|nr:unnamed protein product [Polarella glacialis]CAE8742121.1 unnamed protein product [Polarella glacialis]
MHGQGGQGDCWDFQRGRCAKGDRCRWLHAPPAARPGTGVINAQDWNASEEDAARALCQVVQGELELLKDNNNDGFSAAEGAPAGLWEPFVVDPPRRSYSFVLRREAGRFRPEELARWFQALHPKSSSAGLGVGAWTDAAYQGQALLRKTAWYVRPPCTCAYDYADTHQEIASDAPLRAVLEEITARVAQVCGVELPNSVNLNFYPPGGGVGFHADDEPLFDGLRRDARIISLSLTEPDAEQAAWQQVVRGEAEEGLLPDRPRPPKNRGRGASAWGLDDHGGALSIKKNNRKINKNPIKFAFKKTKQKKHSNKNNLHYLRSAWPGDRCHMLEAPGRSAFGERVNLTWRWIVQHNDKCPLFGQSIPSVCKGPEEL